MVTHIDDHFEKQKPTTGTLKLGKVFFLEKSPNIEIWHLFVPFG
jgi:hypothetical protein